MFVSAAADAVTLAPPTAFFVVLVLTAVPALGLAQVAGDAGSAVGHGERSNLSFDDPKQVVAREGGDAGLEKELFSALLEPFVGAHRNAIGSGDGLAALRNELHVLQSTLRRRVLEVGLKEPAKRSAVIDNVRARARAEFASLGGEPATAFFDRSVADARDEARARLWGKIICWCTDEGWTKTLAGCPDGCANPQKTMVENGLDEGLTDEEIIERMVNDPRGGEQVRASLKAEGFNLVAFWMPVLTGGFALVLVVLALRRLVHRGGADAPAAQRGDGAADGVDGGPAQDRWTELVEKELEELDD